LLARKRTSNDSTKASIAPTVVSIAGITTIEVALSGIWCEKSILGSKLGFTKSVTKKLTTDIASWLAHSNVSIVMTIRSHVLFVSESVINKITPPITNVINKIQNE